MSDVAADTNILYRKENVCGKFEYKLKI